MQTLIGTLLQNHHAYAAAGEVLFDVSSMPDYGQLSKRPLEDNQAGARIAVEAHKKNPADFVLWKQSSAEEPVAGIARGARPAGLAHRVLGDEQSAISKSVFDIHGGGLVT